MASTVQTEQTVFSDTASFSVVEHWKDRLQKHLGEVLTQPHKDQVDGVGTSRDQVDGVSTRRHQVDGVGTSRDQVVSVKPVDTRWMVLVPVETRWSVWHR